MKTLTKFVLTGVLLLAAVCIHALVCGNTLAQEWELVASLLALAPLAASFSGGPSVQDGNYSTTLALMSTANATVTQATGFDMEASSKSDFLALAEGVVTAPVLNTTQLPNAATITYNLIASATPNLATPTTIQTGVIVQTGAGGTGAAAASNRVRFPTNLGSAYGRYIGLQAVAAASNGNCAASSATFKLLF